MPLIKSIFKAAKREIFEGRVYRSLAFSIGTSYLLTQRLGLSCLIGAVSTGLAHGYMYLDKDGKDPLGRGIPELPASYASAAIAMLTYPSPDTLGAIKSLSEYMPLGISAISKTDMNYMLAAPLVAMGAIAQTILGTFLGEMLDSSARYAFNYARDRRQKRNYDPR